MAKGKLHSHGPATPFRFLNYRGPHFLFVVSCDFLILPFLFLAIAVARRKLQERALSNESVLLHQTTKLTQTTPSTTSRPLSFLAIEISRRHDKMGSNQSKPSDKPSKTAATHLYQEKHASADSTMPLAVSASQMAFPATPPSSRHMSWNEHSSRFSRPCTITSIPESPDTHCTTSLSPTTSPQLTPRCASNRNSIYVHETDGHSNVSRPPPPPRIRHLSELIDPDELPAHGYVRSPSGNVLARDQYLAHPDRPLSIRERQEEIREKVRTASRLAMERPPISELEEPKKKV